MDSRAWPHRESASPGRGVGGARVVSKPGDLMSEGSDHCDDVGGELTSSERELRRRARDD